LGFETTTFTMKNLVPNTNYQIVMYSEVMNANDAIDSEKVFNDVKTKAIEDDITATTDETDISDSVTTKKVETDNNASSKCDSSSNEGNDLIFYRNKSCFIKGALNPKFLNLTINREKFWL